MQCGFLAPLGSLVAMHAPHLTGPLGDDHKCEDAFFPRAETFEQVRDIIFGSVIATYIGIIVLRPAGKHGVIYICPRYRY
jgi:hypothetical protein